MLRIYNYVRSYRRYLNKKGDANTNTSTKIATIYYQ
jgi:hypothetical protein